MEKKRSNKSLDIFRLLIGITIVVLVNVLSSFLFTRFDLTSEKRYTLSEPTRELLRKLDEVVYFKVYMGNDYPQGAGDLKHLRDETRIMLQEFRAFAGDNIQFEFIDPSENSSTKEREKLYQQLVDKGLKPISPKLTADEGSITRQVFFPAAEATSPGKHVAVQLFYMNGEQLNPVDVNAAVEKLEYELTNAIRKLMMTRKPKVAFIQGHNEADSVHTADFANALREYYDVSYVTINGSLRALLDTFQRADQLHNRYDVIIINRPDTRHPIPDADKYFIDQHLMYGGKVLWMIDPLYFNRDSLMMKGNTIALNDSTNVDDLFFKYGARVNSDLVLDQNHDGIILNVASPGTPPKLQAFPWLFWPMIQPTQSNSHPIVNGLDFIRMGYTATIDTFALPTTVKKTVLLHTSKGSRIIKLPHTIDLRAAYAPQDDRIFEGTPGNLPVAVLLEGTFESVYRNHLPMALTQSKEIGFLEVSRKPSKMIIIANGDVVATNGFRNGVMEPMGYDPATGITYANKDLMLNCVNYLCEDENLMVVRSRVLKTRQLDKKRITSSRLKWQLYNNLLPIGLISLFGFAAYWLRKRKFGRKKDAQNNSPVFFSIVMKLVFRRKR